MQITHLGHACVLVETDRQRILIDPGNLAPAWHDLDDLDAVFVTHLHADHLDDQALAALSARNRDTRIFVEPTIATLVAEGKLAELPVTPLATGESVTVGEITITGAGGTHAEIHRDIPAIGNVGWVLRAEGEPTFFHPGDSYASVPEGIDVLAVPSYGPWGALKETIDFVRAVGAGHGFPIHDELLSDLGRGLISGRVAAMTGLELADLRGGKSQQYH